MKHCDARTRAYKNGKTFDECKQIAEKMNLDLKNIIEKEGKMHWSEILKG